MNQSRSQWIRVSRPSDAQRTRRPGAVRLLVPLYMEQAAGESLDAAVARAEFDEVWAVLQALQEQDEVHDDLIHPAAAGRPSVGSRKAFVVTRGCANESRFLAPR